MAAGRIARGGGLVGLGRVDRAQSLLLGLDELGTLRIELGLVPDVEAQDDARTDARLESGEFLAGQGGDVAVRELDLDRVRVGVDVLPDDHGGVEDVDSRGVALDQIELVGPRCVAPGRCRGLDRTLLAVVGRRRAVILGVVRDRHRAEQGDSRSDDQHAALHSLIHLCSPDKEHVVTYAGYFTSACLPFHFKL